MVEPSDRMKMDRDHHVPPSDRAVEILREQRPGARRRASATTPTCSRAGDRDKASRIWPCL